MTLVHNVAYFISYPMYMKITGCNLVFTDICNNFLSGAHRQVVCVMDKWCLVHTINRPKQLQVSDLTIFYKKVLFLILKCFLLLADLNEEFKMPRVYVRRLGARHYQSYSQNALLNLILYEH